MSQVIWQLTRLGYLADSYPSMWSLAKSTSSWLWNETERQPYLDFHCGYGSNPLGHNHPALRERMGQSVEETASAYNKIACGDFYTKPLIDFVETFQQDMIPKDMQPAPLFFIDGGAAANDNAIKVAQDYKVQRTSNARATKIAYLTKAFHGRSPGSMSLTNTDPNKTARFAKFNGWPRIPTSDGSLAGDQRLLNELEDTLTNGGGEVAAVAVECIQGEGGDNHLNESVLKSIQMLCNAYDALFWVDEVQTGFYTTGLPWCFQHFGLSPDIVTFGKKSQQCGMWGGPKIAEFKEGCMHQSGRLSSTWSGNLLDMVRSTHIMHIISDERLPLNVVDRGNQFLERMKIIAAKHPQHVSNVRGRGLMIAFDACDRAQRDTIVTDLYKERQLIGLASGERSVRFRPHLAVTEDEMDSCLTRVEKTLKSLYC